MQLGRDPSHRRQGPLRARRQPRLGPCVTIGWRPPRLLAAVYEQLAELADRIDATTQGQIISSVHARVPIVIPNEQRALRVRARPHGVKKEARALEARGGGEIIVYVNDEAEARAKAVHQLRLRGQKIA
jgi:hypothetical protein